MGAKSQSKRINEFYARHWGRAAQNMESLPLSGSDRKYFRLSFESESVIAVFNPVREENDAFVGFTNHFRSRGLFVPEVYYYDAEEGIYFQQDLGTLNLYQFLHNLPESEFNSKALIIYKKVLDQLVRFQVDGTNGLDFNLSYPHRSFDRQSMIWDLNYFKYMFLKLIAVPFNEGLLEKDFNTLIDFLLGAGDEYFLYRDFQSANIMLVDDEPWFIDFQGGRRGAPQYDVASLLYDAKANIPQQSREILLEYYIDTFCSTTGTNRDHFTGYFDGFAMIRLMQALGAFGFRGLYEKKPTFTQSIVPAVRLLRQINSSGRLPITLAHLTAVIDAIPALDQFRSLEVPERLSITISSFSYKNGMPEERVHGGGFVFDCRALDDTSKISEFTQQNGNSEKVISYLSQDGEVSGFINESVALVMRSVVSYKKKNYTRLSVAYGCTDGESVSVYCAERCAEQLRLVEGIDVAVVHNEISKE